MKLRFFISTAFLPVWAATAAPTAPRADPAPASSALGGQIIELDRMTVEADRMTAAQSRAEDFSWSISQFLQGDHFHIPGGQIVDAIVFRHEYLQKHPSEQAIVAVVMDPVVRRVTQAAAVYTNGPALRATSFALGDIKLSGLGPADIDHPEKIQKSLRALRQAYLLGTRGLGTQIAMAESSGDYSILTDGTKTQVNLYFGTEEDMLDSTYHWLSDTAKAGVIPVARGKVKVDLVPGKHEARAPARTVEREAVVFDWDGVHYMYCDQEGTLAMDLPRNLITDTPYLVLQDGDALECLYFMATYAKLHPGEKAVFIQPIDGIHSAVAYSFSGHAAVFSPFLGRFVLPARYSLDQSVALAQLNAGLIARELAKEAGRPNLRPPTAVRQRMPGDSEDQQVRRAYLAFRELGVPVTLIRSATGWPALKVSYRGIEYTYVPPGFAGS